MTQRLNTAVVVAISHLTEYTWSHKQPPIPGRNQRYLTNQTDKLDNSTPCGKGFPVSQNTFRHHLDMSHNIPWKRSEAVRQQDPAAAVVQPPTHTSPGPLCLCPSLVPTKHTQSEFLDSISCNIHPKRPNIDTSPNWKDIIAHGTINHPNMASWWAGTWSTV